MTSSTTVDKSMRAFTQRRLRMIRLLNTRPYSSAELAEALGVHASTPHHTLERLVKEGLVIKRTRLYIGARLAASSEAKYPTASKPVGGYSPELTQAIERMGERFFIESGGSTDLTMFIDHLKGYL